MGDFFDVVFGFPTALFTFLLLVVVWYWIVVLVGMLDADPADSDHTTGLLAGIGLGGVPVTVVVSLLVAFAWFASLAGATLVSGAVLSLVVLVGALAAAWLLTLISVLPLRRLFPAAEGNSRSAFVGRSCVIRTGAVTATFGQAEVTAADGSSAIVQVRQTGEDTFAAGSVAVIYGYDAEGEFFWVVPAPDSLVPEPEPGRASEDRAGPGSTTEL
jgi:hypothetical protein